MSPNVASQRRLWWRRRRWRRWHLNVKSVFCRDVWNCRRSILAPGGSIFVVSRGPSSWSKDWFSIFPWASVSNSISCGAYCKHWLSLRWVRKAFFYQTAKHSSTQWGSISYWKRHWSQILYFLHRSSWHEKKFSFFKTNPFSSGISIAIWGYVYVWWSLILSSFFYK